MKVFTAEQMRAFDKVATEEYHIPSIVLMENAALRVVEFLEMKFAPLREKQIVVLCGKGNNGGDGFAIARHLHAASCWLTLITAPSDLYKGDALQNHNAFFSANDGDDYGPHFHVFNWTHWENSRLEIEWHLNSADILIDALYGTGFQGAVPRPQLDLLQVFVNSSTMSAVRVCVDLPSGMNADNGEMPSNVKTPNRLRRRYTISFVGPKRGQFLRDGPEESGEIWVGSIGTLPSLLDSTRTGCECITRETAHSLLPFRPLDAHKGDAGRVVVCGGSYGMSGAPILAAKAVLKSGAGLCIACVPDRVLPAFAAAFSEATSHPLACDEEGRLIEEAADAMPKYWESAHAVALGPGLSRSEGSLSFARRVVQECPHPLIIDADALYALRAIKQDVKQREAPTILTPHPGEMGELMEMDTKEVQNDRIGVAIACAKRYNAIVVLKGARSIVAMPDGYSYINLTGNSGMATGGSGDVLTGTIAGLLAQIKDAKPATLLGVYLHGLAGDLEYSEKGNGLIAGDIAEALPRAMLKIQEPPEVSPNGRLRRLY